MLFTIQIGRTLYICDETTIDGVKAKANKALAKGSTIVLEDGRTLWYDYWEIIDTTKLDQGSEAYSWDKSGNKVRHDKYLMTKHPDGRVEKKHVGTVFRKWR